MYDDQIEKLNEWFESEDRSYGTYHNDGDEYAVCAMDMEDFSNFLRENIMDLIGIPCMVGNDGIWFRETDLEGANFY